MAKRKAAKRKALKKVPKRKAILPKDRLRGILAGHSKEDLVEIIVELAQNDPRALRQIQQRFKVEESMSLEELVAATREAISDATEVDMQSLNHNFEYDYAAYETVARNFMKLVTMGHWEQVMELSVELMHKGSYQVECSDEGLMTDDIQECLLPVINAVSKSGLKSLDIFHWTKLMLATDRVGFICQKEVLALQASVLK